MYITELKLKNVRTFVDNRIEFVHPDQNFAARGTRPEKPGDLLPRPVLPNVNLLLGDNGSGKSTILRAIALTACGPAVKDSGLRDPGLVRRMVESKRPKSRVNKPDKLTMLRPFADMRGAFILHPQDRAAKVVTQSHITVSARFDLEQYGFEVSDEAVWEPVFEEKTDAFFVVGYGATRRVERAENFDMGARTRARYARSQRVAGLFEDFFSLIPLTYWLPDLQKTNKGRYKQVVGLMNRLLDPGLCTFTEAQERGAYLFERGGLQIPFQALSDGYRAFIGWVGDLLYHVCYGAPSGKKLVESSGIVLVDEIDLHLHPRWQMQVIKTIAEALPRMQFVFTSHSPLVAGSLEWMNIITLKTDTQTNHTVTERLQQSIHGLDADQILLSDFFGLSSTRADAKKTQLDNLTARAREGDDEAALKIVQELSRGLEDAP